MFTNRASGLTSEINILDHSINWSNSIKYLGTHIDNKLNFTEQTKHTINQAKRTKFKLYPLLNKNSTLLTRTKLYIYKTYPTLRSLILDGRPLDTSTKQNRNSAN